MRIAMLVGVMILVTSVAYACPASYVHGQAQSNSNSPHAQKVNQVADNYLTNRGVDPNSPVGQTVKPYVVGTAWVEDRNPNSSSTFRINSMGVDQLTQNALGSYAGQQLEPNNDPENNGHGWHTHPSHHFRLHAGYGMGQTPSQPPQTQTDKKGG